VTAAGSIYQTDLEDTEGYVEGTNLVAQNGWSGLSPINPAAAGIASAQLHALQQWLLHGLCYIL
jgi:hypothetical protein